MSKYKVTSKIEYDKMFVRIADGKNYVRVGITRSGWRLTGNGLKMKKLAVKIKKQFEELLDNDFTYGDVIKYLVIEYS